MWQRKGNLKKETESLLIAAHNNAIRTNHIKVRINKTQQNSRYKLCGVWDEAINHIISKCKQISSERESDETRLGGQFDPWENLLENVVWPYEQMVEAQCRNFPGK